MQSLTDVKKISLITRIDAALDNNVLADSGKIHQLFYNLIGNAIKFTNIGSIAVDCSLTKKEHHSRLDVTVKDIGIGIAKADPPQVFDNVFESKKYKDRIGFADGLGLGLCKHIVELYDGTIDIESEIGQGTEIRFSLFVQNYTG